MTLSDDGPGTCYRCGSVVPIYCEDRGVVWCLACDVALYDTAHPAGDSDASDD